MGNKWKRICFIQINQLPKEIELVVFNCNAIFVLREDIIISLYNYQAKET